MRRLLLALLLVLAPTPAWAAIAEVGGGSQRANLKVSGSGSGNVAYPGNVVAGNLLTVQGSVYNTASVITVTNDCGTTYTILEGTGTSSGKEFVAFGTAGSSGACTVTVGSTGSYFAATIDEFSGAGGLDVDGGQATGTSSTPTGSITTTVGNALVLCVFNGVGSLANPPTATGGYTLIGYETSFGSYSVYGASFKIVGAAGAYSPGFDTTPDANDWAAYTISFAPSGGAAATRPRRGRGPF